VKSTIQPYLFWILLVFLGVGVFYPAIGLVAILCMLAPVLLAPFRGRYWCGNFCPRGSFYDSVIAKISPKKPIPAFFRSNGFRIFMVMFIMGVFSVQMYYAWGDLSAMGAVFFRIILITTIVGIVLGVVYHQRTWCSFCPMGTMASWLSAKPKPRPLKVENSCVSCKLCTTACPLQLSPYTAKGSEEGFTHSDCLKCSRCVEKCPKKALVFQDK
jgi:polyferredoxin